MEELRRLRFAFYEAEREEENELEQECKDNEEYILARMNAEDAEFLEREHEITMFEREREYDMLCEESPQYYLEIDLHGYVPAGGLYFFRFRRYANPRPQVGDHILIFYRNFGSRGATDILHEYVLTLDLSSIQDGYLIFTGEFTSYLRDKYPPHTLLSDADKNSIKILALNRIQKENEINESIRPITKIAGMWKISGSRVNR